MRRAVIVACVLLLCLLLATTQFSLFVIPPIGAVPEGRTLVISRLTNLHFVDSPDAVCERIQGGVNLLCRGMVMGKVASEAKILLRLPYSKTLDRMSTGGRVYE